MALQPPPEQQDTAASIAHLTRLVRRASDLPAELRLLDLCTGTGCIPLLFRHELYAARRDISLRVLAVDVSQKALDLARHNLRRANTARPRTEETGHFDLLAADILVDAFADPVDGPPSLHAALLHANLPRSWDLLIANPPYISPSGYWKSTTRSVRAFEPKLALVPPHTPGHSDTEQADLFYPRLLDIARHVEAKVVLLEVADLEQARRVARRAQELGVFDGIEIWRDDPAVSSSTCSPSDAVGGYSVIGDGNARTLALFNTILFLAALS
ncbi:hypothetical protein ACEQ8H_005044 [Pleosporales sp. CAS-2024a]